MRKNVEVGFAPGTDLAPIPGSPALVIAIRLHFRWRSGLLPPEAVPEIDVGGPHGPQCSNKRGLSQTN